MYLTLNSTHVTIDILTINEVILNSFSISRPMPTSKTTTGNTTPPPIPMNMIVLIGVGSVVIGVVVLVTMRRRWISLLDSHIFVIVLVKLFISSRSSEQEDQGWLIRKIHIDCA